MVASETDGFPLAIPFSTSEALNRMRRLSCFAERFDMAGRHRRDNVGQLERDYPLDIRLQSQRDRRGKITRLDRRRELQMKSVRGAAGGGATAVAAAIWPPMAVERAAI